MWEITSNGPAIAALMLGMCAAGSWIQPMRYISKKHALPSLLVLYFDWKLVHWLLVVLFSLVLGSIGPAQPSVFDSLRRATGDRIICALLGGAAITSGDILIYFGDALCGTALAFPICVGLCSAVGTLFVYLVQPKGNPAFLFAGIGAAFVAVVFGGLATWVKQREAAAATAGARDVELTTKGGDGGGGGRTLMLRGVVLSGAAGLVYAAWSPLGTLAAKGAGCPRSFTGLSAHAVWLLFVTGMFASNLPLLYVALRWPLSPTVKPQSPWRAWRALRWSDQCVFAHCIHPSRHASHALHSAWAAIPGVLSFIIFASNFLASGVTGFASA